MATTCIITATITDPSQTNLLGNAFIKFRLRNFTGFVPQVVGTSLIVEDTIDAYPNPAGVISQVLTCNTAISPVNTFYTCEMWNQGRIVSSANYIFNGNTSLNTAGNLNPAPAPYAPYGILFENNGAPNSSQYVLNLESTDGTVAITDVGGGTLNLQNAGGPSFGTGGQGGFWGPGWVVDDMVAQTGGTSTPITNIIADVLCYQFVLYSKWTISKCTSLLTTANASAGYFFNFGIYSAAGNLLIDAGGWSTHNTANTPFTNSFTPTTLPPGTYYFAQTATITTAAHVAIGGSGNNYSNMYNANGLRTVLATNQSTGAAVMPATLGVLTNMNSSPVSAYVAVALPFWEP
jgi:hypothetical protein